MKRIVLFVLMFVVSSLEAGSGGFSSLVLGLDARSVSLGKAVSAWTGDASAPYWNPAALGSGPSDCHLSAAVYRWIEGIHGEFLSFVRTGEHQSLGLYTLYTEVGGIEYRTVPSPEPSFTFSSHEWIAGAAYARTWKQRITVGLGLKMLYGKMFVDEVWGLAADAGVLVDVNRKGLKIGVVLQHLGGTGKLKEETIALPATARIGVSVPVKALGFSWSGLGETVWEKGFPVRFRGGLEWGWKKIVFVRFGYQTGLENGAATAGFGLGWGVYRLDYAFVPGGMDLGDAHRLTFGISW